MSRLKRSNYKFGNVYIDKYDESRWILIGGRVDKDYSKLFYVTGGRNNLKEFLRHVYRKHIKRIKIVQHNIIDIRYELDMKLINVEDDE